jgi:hypothetical protein
MTTHNERVARLAAEANRFLVRDLLLPADGAPPWFTDVCRHAHGGMMPDDWRYEFIQDALSAIEDGADEDRLYAGYAQEPPERFKEAVLIELEEWAEELARKVRRLEGEAVAVARLLDGGKARQKAAKLLPGDGRDERIAKYERHLHNLLTSTLHELERLQARREGEPMLPPAVADVTVTLDAGAG